MTDWYKIKRWLIRVNNPDSRNLPSAYQQVDYIQCSGTQWIDTWYTYTNPNKIKYELSYNLTASPDQFSYFGSRLQTWTWDWFSWIPYGWAIYSNTTSFWSISASTNTNYVLSVEFTPSNNTSTVVQYTNGTKTYDQTYTNSSYIPPTQTQHIWLFCDINWSWSAIQLASMKAYSFKIWDTDILVRDFVPCYRKSDNVIGMYDLVNNQFYTNSWSWTFSKGNDVTSLVEKQFYPSNNINPYNLLTDVIAYYPMQQNLNDIWPNWFNLTLTTWSYTIGTNWIETGSSFDAKNTTATYPTNSSVTCNMWINGWIWWFYLGNDSYVWWWMATEKNSSYNWTSVVVSSTEFRARQSASLSWWNMLTWVFDYSAHTITYYLNWNLIASTSTNSWWLRWWSYIAYWASPSKIWIGFATANAMTQAQIQEFYNASKSIYGL